MLLSYYKRPLFILFVFYSLVLIFLNFLKEKKEERIYYIRDRLCGKVMSYPQESRGLLRFEFLADYAQDKKRFIAYLKDKADFSLYDEICFDAEMSKPYSSYVPGLFDWRLFLQNKGIGLQAFGKDAQLVKKSFLLFRTAGLIRKKVLEIFENNLNEKEYSILSGIVLGVKTKNDKELNRAFSLSGTAHLLVASGGNVAVLLGFSYFLFRLIGLGKFLGYLIGLFICGFYVFICGLDPPLVRAFLMAVAGIFAFLSQRKKDVFQILIIASFALVLINPYYLFDAGFQMSVAAVYGLAAGFGARKDFFKRKRNKFFSYILNLFFISLFAQAALTPLLIFYFNYVPVAGIAANMIAVPLACLLLPAGLVSAFLSFFIKELAVFLFFPISILLKSLLHCVYFFSKLHFAALNVPYPGFLVLLSLSFCIFVFLHWPLFKNKKKAIILSAIFLFGSIMFRYYDLNKPFQKEFYAKGEKRKIYYYKGELYLVNPWPSCEEIKKSVNYLGFGKLAYALYEGDYDKDTALCIEKELKSKVCVPFWQKKDSHLVGVWAGDYCGKAQAFFKESKSGYSGYGDKIEYFFD
ncbi:MAG: ComEC family competence protein [Elusimicrobia bacterium]|nr:ComEC family competence protein [Elusimicrobiota bacterium]